MRYRILGKTNLKVSVIGVGTWQFGGEWGHQYTQQEADAVLDEAAACEMNVIDTAECYGDHTSERLVGDWLSRQNRDDWIVATKFGHRFHGFMDRTWDLSPEGVQQQLEASLKSLKVDTIDLYQFHSGPNDLFQNDELWSMLQKQKDTGKIRHLGISISSKADQLQAEQASAVGAEMLQILYNRLDQRALKDFFPPARKQNLGVFVRVPLASGYLTGKYKPGSEFTGEDVRATHDFAHVQEQLREVERIQAEEVPPGVPMAEWALAWCLDDPIVSCVIPGCKNPQQVRSNAHAAEVEL